MSKIVNEYGVINQELVLNNIALTNAVNALTSELKTFVKVFELNGEEIAQLYDHFAGEITVAGIEEKMRWGITRRKELREAGTRGIALTWWRNMTDNERKQIAHSSNGANHFLKEIEIFGADSLTGRIIKELYLENHDNETQQKHP